MEQQTTPVKKQRILSGIQPSGTPTLGNYIGALRNCAKLLEDDYDCLYSDRRSCTPSPSGRNPAELRAPLASSCCRYLHRQRPRPGRRACSYCQSHVYRARRA